MEILTSHDKFPSMESSWTSVEVEQIQQIKESYLILSLRRPVGFPFLAGQHTTLQLTDKEGSFQRIYSIASSPQLEDSVQFCIQSLGDGRTATLLRSLSRGDRIQLGAPQGSFKLVERKRPFVFIAGGSGIGPIRSFLQDVVLGSEKSDFPLTLIYGCREADAIPFQDELLLWSTRPQLQLKTHLFAESGSHPQIEKGTVLTALSSIQKKFSPSSHFYLCGPKGMIDAVTSALRQNGIHPDHIFTENY